MERAVDLSDCASASYSEQASITGSLSLGGQVFGNDVTLGVSASVSSHLAVATTNAVAQMRWKENPSHGM
jgi:hypothetical protein